MRKDTAWVACVFDVCKGFPPRTSTPPRSLKRYPNAETPGFEENNSSTFWRLRWPHKMHKASHERKADSSNVPMPAHTNHYHLSEFGFDPQKIARCAPNPHDAAPRRTRTTRGELVFRPRHPPNWLRSAKKLRPARQPKPVHNNAQGTAPAPPSGVRFFAPAFRTAHSAVSHSLIPKKPSAQS